jgi:hypothetical protein
MAQAITAAARARFDPAEPHYQGPPADAELQATHREAAMLMAATALEADAERRKAWRARQEKSAGRRWPRIRRAAHE